MCSWRETSWGELGALEYGRALRDYRDGDGSVRVYGTNGPIGWTSSAQSLGPGVIVGRKGAVRGVHYSSGSFWVIDTAYWLRLTARIDPRWAYYQLLTQDINGRDSGSAIPSLSRSDFASFSVLLPPFEEQRAIGEILGTLDDKIEANRITSALMRELALALFIQWSNGKKSLERSPRVFGDLVEDNIGGDWGKEAEDADFNSEVVVIRGTDLPDLVSGGKARVPRRFIKASSLAKRQLRPGDIVVEVSGGSPTHPTGRSLLITQSLLDRFSVPAICASFCRRLRPTTFELGLLASAHLTSLYASGGTWEYQLQSTGIANFQTSDFLRRERVSWPSDAELKTFASSYEPLTRSTRETAKLVDLRDALLPKLVFGDVRVRDAEELVNEAV
jgi:type I restriction enzyme S subunit